MLGCVALDSLATWLLVMAHVACPCVDELTQLLGHCGRQGPFCRLRCKHRADERYEPGIDRPTGKLAANSLEVDAQELAYAGRERLAQGLLVAVTQQYVK
eukprot:scaffold5880_cov32-Tisochrysis_lutea.AAC.7